METSYDSNHHLLTIRFVHTNLSNTAKQSVGTLRNEFVKSADAIQSGSDALVRLTLAAGCTHYNAKQYQMYDHIRNPYVTFQFAEDMDITSPMKEEK